MYYRKKPVRIEAREFDGSARSALEIIDWAGMYDRKVYIVNEGEDHYLRRTDELHLLPLPNSHGGTQYVVNENAPAFLVIPTEEGEMRADIYDMIIRGVENEFYPCKPLIFTATYILDEHQLDSLI